MISNNQEKLIKSLQTKKGRTKEGLCLVEGQKVIDTAGEAVDFEFTQEDSTNFNDLVTTETPQGVAAVAKIPEWTKEELLERKVLVVLDGVQDPGNVGTILRLCLGFEAGLLLVESADVTSPKVIRSSVGAMFQVPWMKVRPEEVDEYLENYKIFRLEKRVGTEHCSVLSKNERVALIAGSEGQGIKLDIKGESLEIKHSDKLESLNVATAVAISLWSTY